MTDAIETVIDRLTELGCRPKRSGATWSALCPAHEDHNASLSISEGRIQPIVLHCFRGCSFTEIVSTLGLRSSDIGERSQRVDSERQAQVARLLEQRRQFIDRILMESWPIRDGGPVDRYLNSRGFTGPWPNDLREHHRLYHSPCKREHAAMVARIRNVHGYVTAVHRIYVTGNGRKVECRPCKMMLGECKGGTVRLGSVTPILALTEGIEDAIAVMHARRDVTAWSCLSASMMEQVELPPEVRHVAIVPDRDPTGIRAAQTLQARLVQEGRAVELWWPKLKDAAASWEISHAR